MNFITYYTISGAIWAVICAVKYKDISKQDGIVGEVVRSIGIEMFVLINFFIGFLNLPIAVPVMIRTQFLKIKLNKLKEENEELARKVESAKKELNNKLQELKGKFKKI